MTVLRVLGLQIQQDGAGHATLTQLQTTVMQLVGLIRRITHRRQGLKERDTVSLVQALLISRITYGTPYLTLKPAESNKLNALILRSYKMALGLPITTSTIRFQQLGVHNTLEELIEAHLTSQKERLLLTTTGRSILSRLGYPLPPPEHTLQRIPPAIRRHITVSPIPRHMHPTYNQGRRKARAAHLYVKYGSRDDTRYVDASPYSSHSAHTSAVVDSTGSLVNSATTPTNNITTAEEIAIALAAHTDLEYVTILTDSQTACRHYQAGRISALALRILAQRSAPIPDIRIVWTPGHTALPGNEAAHASARALIPRAPTGADDPSASPPIPLRYADILAHLRRQRQHFSPPHPNLPKTDECILRRLQTNTFPHGTRLHAMYPAQYSPKCKHCPSPCTLYHMVWECHLTPTLLPLPNPTPEQWEGQLASGDLGDQQQLISRAQLAARAQGLLD